MSEFMHEGVKRRSGRYEWGSGENPYQHEPWYNPGSNPKETVKKLKENGLTNSQISEILKNEGLNEKQASSAMEIKTTQYRNYIKIAREKKLAQDRTTAEQLKSRGWSNVAIAERMKVSEGTVRNLLKPGVEEKANIINNTSTMLKESLNKTGYLDVGLGTERYLGISRDRLRASLQQLKEEGYKIYYIEQTQQGTGKKTNTMVLSKPEGSFGEVFNDQSLISPPFEYSDDGGRSYRGIKPVTSINSNTIKINYAEDGGTEKDGLIELRRGVPELSLGGNNYAQVRIAVDGSHYLKGMAVYADDLPKGINVRFNTNKHKGTPMLGPKDNTVLKPLKKDEQGNIKEEDPFGASIKQQDYIDKDGKQKLSPINIVSKESDWDKWSKNLSSQMLSKQSPDLAKQQLTKDYDKRVSEFELIKSLTNPIVRREMLDEFASSCDSAAVELKAAALPRQATKVILPVPELKATEVYAPGYRNGEKVVLVRHPHGGIFEIPELTVNNKNEKARRQIGEARDAIGINATVAEQLSGADFDGDTVIIIPNNSGKIKHSSVIKGLKNFDPKIEYKGYPGMKAMTDKEKQPEMGKASNLITDMTIKGASEDEIAHAVRYSMVVIDAPKHFLNVELAYQNEGIAHLKEKWQGGAKRGASTLISRAKSEKHIPERTEGIYVKDEATGTIRKRYIDPETGKKLYTNTDREIVRVTYKNPETGKLEKKVVRPNSKFLENPNIVSMRKEKVKIESTKMYETDDAYTLSSGTKMEAVYADYANSMKSLANEARKEYLRYEKPVYVPSASKIYKDEVESLKSRIKIAEDNAPRERAAQRIAASKMKALYKENPGLKEDKDKQKKLRNDILTESRRIVGAKKQVVNLTDKEWEAIQAGAITPSMTERLVKNADLDRLKELAMPRNAEPLMSKSMITRARNMLRNGVTQADIADALGVSVSTLKRELNA